MRLPSVFLFIVHSIQNRATTEDDIATPVQQLESKDADWRVGLLQRVRVLVVLVFALSGMATYAGAESNALRILAAGLIVTSGAILWMMLKGRISISVFRDSVILIGVFLIADVSAYTILGFMPGPVLGAAFAILLTALLFGQRAFVIMLLFHVALLAGLAVAIGTGILDGPNPADIDPQKMNTWFRTGVVTVILWGGIGICVLFVVNTIESVSENRRVALEKLQAEVAEREAAESARREAEVVASQAQKMEAVGQLAAGIAHDVNNSLLVIQGWNELRSELDTTDDQRDATVAIQEAALHTAQLSRQLLTFARKEVRRPEYLHLDEFVGGMIPTLRRLVGSNIEIEFETGNQALIHADKSQLQQLLFNLAINARDALTESGSIKIRVRHAVPSETSEYEGGDNGWTMLEIEDNGPGIDEATKERVFEPFFTTKDSDKGTGLGLSTVLVIVQQSHGHIELSSRPGRTVFSIFLPRADGDLAKPMESMPDEKSRELKLRILVVEDDALARQMIVKVLTSYGNSVNECASGDDALELLAADSQPYDLLCSDAVFPGAGLSTVIKSFERHSPEAKVMICSGYVREELAVRKVETRDYAFLAKPFTGSQLIAEIRDVFGETKSA